MVAPIDPWSHFFCARYHSDGITLKVTLSR